MNNGHSPSLTLKGRFFSPDVRICVHWRQMTPVIWFLEIMCYSWANIQNLLSFFFFFNCRQSHSTTLFGAITFIMKFVMSLLEIVTTLAAWYCLKLSQTILNQRVSPPIYGAIVLGCLTRRVLLCDSTSNPTEACGHLFFDLVSLNYIYLI